MPAGILSRQSPVCAECGIRAAKTRRLCQRCYDHARWSGTLYKWPLESIDEKLTRMSALCPTTGCVLWQGYTEKTGYGRIGIGGGERILVHRLSWELHYGAIPPGLSVLHKCDTPPCIRPDHLFLGTLADNNADKIAKGRDYSKLTEDDVLRIRAMAGVVRQKDMAQQFNVTRANISAVVTQRSWKRLP